MIPQKLLEMSKSKQPEKGSTSCDEDLDARSGCQQHGGRHSRGAIQAFGHDQRQIPPGCLDDLGASARISTSTMWYLWSQKGVLRVFGTKCHQI